MANYTRLSDKDIDLILENYTIGKRLDSSTMTGGQANSSYIIKTVQGNFILSVCDEKNSQEINTLAMVLKYLESLDYPTSRLVQTLGKSDFMVWSDKPVYIKRYLDGDVVKELSSTMLIQVGEAIAKLHETTPLNTMPLQFPYGLASFDQVLEARISHSYIHWLKEKKEFLDNSLDSSMNKGFIHGDIFWDNLLFSNGNLIAVLDFEEACQYYYLFDIGMCAVGCCSQNGIFDLAKISDLVRGYQSRLKLNLQEQKQLKIFIEYAAVAGSFWRFRQYYINYPDEKQKNSYLELSNLADQIHEISESEFIKLVF